MEGFLEWAESGPMILLDDSEVMGLARPELFERSMFEAFRRSKGVPPRTHFDLPGIKDGKLLLMPAWAAGDAIGAKIITVYPDNTKLGRNTVDGVYVLFDFESGHPIAVIRARALTGIRTAAVSAVATKLLARRDSNRLLIVGTGDLAPYLIRSHSSLCQISEIRIWGRRPDRAEALALAMSDGEMDVQAVLNLDEAIANSDVICAATMAHEPLIHGALVAPGTHLNLMGSFSIETREADSQLFAKARTFVDTESAMSECGDLAAPLSEGLLGDGVEDLSALIQAPELGRRDQDEITVFKSVGTAVADLAAAQLIVALARSRGSIKQPTLF